MPLNSLSESLPDNPLPLFATWFDEARTQRLQPNPDAMVVATVGAENRPAARVVLCKQLNAESGYLVFFTNYLSRKGRELQASSRAAAVLHWDAMQRQVRVEGPVVESPAVESDRYFESRALDSRIGAWASRQSEPLDSRSTLISRFEQTAARFGVNLSAAQGNVPRPPHWGGFRLWIETIELWNEGAHRIHDRAVWERELRRSDEYTFDAGSWRASRLNP